MKRDFIKIADLFLLTGFVIGVVGGFGHLCFIGEYVCALGVLVTAVLAYPQVINLINDLMS